MVKIRTLKGAAHDVVDHSMSALGWMHPHVYEYAKSRRLSEVQIDLVGRRPLKGWLIPKPLRLAAHSLQQWFESLLNDYGFNRQDLRAAKLIFGAFGSDPYSPAATCILIAASGRVFRHDRGWPPNSPLQPTSTASRLS